MTDAKSLPTKQLSVDSNLSEQKATEYVLAVNGQHLIRCGPVLTLTKEYMESAIQMVLPGCIVRSYTVYSDVTNNVVVHTESCPKPIVSVRTTCGQCNQIHSTDGVLDVDICPERHCDHCQGKHWKRTCPILKELKELNKTVTPAVAM